MSYCVPDDEFFNPYEADDCDGDDYGYPDTKRIADLDDADPPLPAFPMIWPTEPILQMIDPGYDAMTEAWAKSRGLVILREPKTATEADEICRVVLSMSAGFLARLYTNLHDGIGCRIDRARPNGRQYMDKLAKASPA